MGRVRLLTGILTVASLASGTLNTASAALSISEIQAVNDITIRDDDGEYSDWIEIHNSAATAENLDGWHLTDSALRFNKWRFPNISIPAGGYLVVFASGKNRANATAGPLHTNFKLDAGGEYLALVDPGGNVVSEFAPTYPAWESSEVSFGRDRNEPSLIGFFTVPTPGAPNQAGGPGAFAPDVVFSRASGAYVDSFQLTLSLSPPNAAAEIRYVIVNNAATAAQTNVPTSSAALYTGPITISGTMQVRARAFEPGKLPGSPVTASYIQLNSNAVSFTSDLPLVIVHNFGASEFPTTVDQTAIVAWFEVDEQTGRSSLTNPPTLISRAGVNRRGSSTEGYAKASLAVELWDEFNDDADYEVLGLPAESDWILDAPVQFDRSLIHDPFAYELSNDLGRYASRTRMVETFFDTSGGAVNLPDFSAAGDYDGVHVLQEKIKRNRNRVNIDRMEQENTTPPNVTGGWLLKIDRRDTDERGFEAARQTIIYQDPDGRDVELPQWDPQEQYIAGYFNSFGTALNGVNWTNPVTGYAAYIDVDSWIDHHLLNVMTMSVDSLRLSAYFYKPRNGKIQMGPVWDFGRALGANARGADWRPFNPRAWRASNVIGGSDYGTDFFNTTTPPSWWGRLFTDPDFFQRYIDTYQRYRAGVFDTNRILAKIDRLAEEVREAQTREAIRWTNSPESDTRPRSGTVTAPFNIYSYEYSHTFPTPGTYQGEIDFLKHWMWSHLNFMDTNFLARPTFNRRGGMITAPTELTMAAPTNAATIYYTLDGTDPRMTGGGVLPSAILYTGPISIATNAHVIARSRNLNHRNLTGPGHPPLSSPWSGPSEVSFYAAVPNLRITEIMYHAPPAGGNADATDDFDYIEVTNIGDTPLNLNRFRLRGGIEFDFGNLTLAAGQSAVVVANSAAFLARYGSGATIAGVYTNSLDNAGARLVLEGPLQEPIHDFTYSDRWHPSTDGAGFSLVIVDPAGDLASWGLAGSWRPSAFPNGSPGTPDPSTPVIPRVVINEVLTHADLPLTDTIELYNPTGDAVNIGGWFLSDDFSYPKKFRLPSDTIVPAGGFVFFNQSQFNTGPVPFALSSLGEEVWLFSGDGTNLTGYAHGFHFGAAFSGRTFGRHIISTGSEEFPAQITATFGQANAGPRVGPMVISEIFYHPPGWFRHGVARDNRLDEFIELQNITDDPVPLYDVARPTNTWRLREAVSFEFPSGAVVPEGGRILVVGFDPADTLKLDGFRARNGVPAGVPIYGPFRGHLDNSHAVVELCRPDRPEPPGPPHFGLVPYPRVEHVHYTDFAPWPVAADGVGPSLQRVLSSAYGNDPVNWIAALPTPGAALDGTNAPVISQQPASQTVVAFNDATFSVAAAGADNHYQWRFNHVPLVEQTNETLTLQSVRLNQQGVYDVLVFNSGGSIVSDAAFLTVLQGVVISRQPQSVFLRGQTNEATYGETFHNATFAVEATSGSPIYYQWRFNSNNIPAANPTLIITNANLSHEGLYDCLLSDAVGTVRSAAALLRVNVPIHITRHPQPIVALVGDHVALSVDHRGTAPVAYQWRRNGLRIFAGSGYTPSRVLTLSNVTTSISGNYTVAITNGTIPGVLSRAALLTVLADSDGDKAPDTWETQFGFLPNDPDDGAMDFDSDGVSNADEFRSGTDPTDGTSFLDIEEFSLGGVAFGSRISFLAVSNRTYSVQYKDALDPDSVWTTLDAVLAHPTNRPAVVIDPNPVASRFYRLVTPLLQD